MATTIQTEINDAIRIEAEEILQGLGLTLPDAVAMLMRHIVAENGLPFESDCPHCPIIPGPATLTAMAEAERGGLPEFNSIEELMADLDADD